MANGTQGGKTVSKMVTPAVRARSRQHFGCDTLEGAEIEDGGGSGTAGSHLEKRIFMNEFMTGTASREPVFSAITLAVFEDSGWYRAVLVLKTLDVSAVYFDPRNHMHLETRMQRNAPF